LAGGWLGAYIGAEKLKSQNMKYILAAVLVLAAGKMIFI
jgi:uncharacterized membrane protein YfcA